MCSRALRLRGFQAMGEGGESRAAVSHCSCNRKNCREPPNALTVPTGKRGDPMKEGPHVPRNVRCWPWIHNPSRATYPLSGRKNDDQQDCDVRFKSASI
jgi:hypothetical protein